MPWIEVSISIGREAIALAEAALEERGALAITLEDDADDPVLEPGPGSTPLWPTIHLRGLFDVGVDRDAVMTRLAGLPGADKPDFIRWREVGDQDWERAWMDRFRPMRFGRRLWIVPGGMSIEADPGNIEVRLDPGLAFGTGSHPTTALCLEWIDAQDFSARSIVDYGCGSGILGIAAALAGAARVVCVDNDPQALEATAENARRNGISGRIQCTLPDGFEEQGADAVLANILAEPLVALAPVIAGCTRPGAPVVLSGLLEEQGERVAAVYEEWCEKTGGAERDGWLRLDFRRRS